MLARYGQTNVTVKWAADYANRFKKIKISITAAYTIFCPG
jgi:hypothetical protein